MKKKRRNRIVIDGLDERHIAQLVGIQMTEQVVASKKAYNRQKEKKVIYDLETT